MVATAMAMNGEAGAAPGGASTLWSQRTLKSRIPCVGIGVHSGRRVSLTLLPAPAGHGIVFRRVDLGRDIPATYDRVVDTKLCTMIGEGSARVGTIEHLMAALAGAGVDNVVIEVDGPEVPIMDGSAAPFSFLLECAGVVSLNTPRKVIEILRPIRVTDGKAFAELRPFEPERTRTPVPTLELEVSIDFADARDWPAEQHAAPDPGKFPRGRGVRPHLRARQRYRSPPRTGPCKGGSLDNAIVVDGSKVLNPGGLRMKHEFAAHKLVDAVGDLALAGAALHGQFIANRPGHALNNKLLKAFFSRARMGRHHARSPGRRRRGLTATLFFRVA